MDIIYGVTHCTHCEKQYAPEGEPPGNEHLCYDCSPTLQDIYKHLIAALAERDLLRAQLAQVHRGQLSLIALVDA